jgi:hypothetical protein
LRLLDFLERERQGVVVLGVLVARPLDVVRRLRIGRRELDERHEPIARLGGRGSALKQRRCLAQLRDFGVLMRRIDEVESACLCGG